MEAVVLLVIAFGIAYACGSIAKGKNQSFGLWFVLGLFFPIIALVVVLLLSDAPAARRARPRSRPRSATRPVSVSRATTTGRKPNPFRSR